MKEEMFPMFFLNERIGGHLTIGPGAGRVAVLFSNGFVEIVFLEKKNIADLEIGSFTYLSLKNGLIGFLICGRTKYTF